MNILFNIKKTYNLNVAMKNNNLSKIRKKLDSLDDKLLLLIKKRMVLVNQVLKKKNLNPKLLIKKELKQY